MNATQGSRRGKHHSNEGDAFSGESTAERCAKESAKAPEVKTSHLSRIADTTHSKQEECEELVSKENATDATDGQSNKSKQRNTTAQGDPRERSRKWMK